MLATWVPWLDATWLDWDSSSVAGAPISGIAAMAAFIMSAVIRRPYS